MQTLRAALGGISRAVLGFLGAGSENHRSASDPWGWGRIAARQAERAAQVQPILRPRQDPQVAGDPRTGWRPSGPRVLSARMPVLDYGSEGARPASSYRGARRNAARIGLA